jgi:hypothetical protein
LCTHGCANRDSHLFWRTVSIINQYRGMEGGEADGEALEMESKWRVGPGCIEGYINSSVAAPFVNIVVAFRCWNHKNRS